MDHDGTLGLGGDVGLEAVMHRIAWVDLETRRVEYEQPSDDRYCAYLGGYGLGAYYLYTRQKSREDPLGRAATLAFLAGPLTGTPAITGNRFTVVAKSPKTGAWGDANCGGSFGPALKRAGIDGLFVTGVAPSPTYLLVERGEVSLHDATDYWGLLTSQTEQALRTAHGKSASAAVIGPSGENVRLLACIINDEGRAAGRSGLGAVMGSKKLKAVVAVGAGKIGLADEAGLRALRRRLQAAYCTSDDPTWNELHTYGTPASLVPSVVEGDTPIRNWAGVPADLPGVERIGGDALKKLQVRGYACWGCPIGCGGRVEVAQGPYAGAGHKPEYETLAAFGALCLNDDLESICRLNNICNECGIDTISTGATLAFAMECFENGELSTEDLGGIALRWGDHGAMVAITEHLGAGVGPAADLLGDGTQKAVQRLGGAGAASAIACGGEELGMHDPRCYPGIAVSYQADATPGRHTQGGSWFAECAYLSPDTDYSTMPDKHDYGAKGELHKRVSCFHHCLNMLGLCQFSSGLIPWSVVPEYLTLATGRDFTMQDLLEIGERAANLRLAFNLREGILNADDYQMPKRALGEPPLSGGPTEGITVDNARQLREYYRAMGWDARGVPRPEVFQRLSLAFALDALDAPPLAKTPSDPTRVGDTAAD
jgi:aldehyde:ferredoxin oxidoreductase